MNDDKNVENSEPTQKVMKIHLCDYVEVHFDTHIECIVEEDDNGNITVISTTDEISIADHLFRSISQNGVEWNDAVTWHCYPNEGSPEFDVDDE